MSYYPSGDDYSTGVSQISQTAPAAAAADSGFNWGQIFAGVGAGLSSIFQPKPPAGQTPPIYAQPPMATSNGMSLGGMLPYLALGGAAIVAVVLLTGRKSQA